MEKRYQEAIERLNLLNAPKFIVDAFSGESRQVMCSRSGKAEPLNPQELKLVQELEQTLDILVYHVVLSDTSSLGEMYTLLYVSSYEEEWSSDREYLMERVPIVYVYNATYPDCSEFGSVELVLLEDGFIRTA